MTPEETEKTVPTMSAQEFIAGCNQRGSMADRFLETVAGCNPVPPFTKQGLAHLAGLLTDKNTASGGVQRPGLTPDTSKEWAMGFLSRFNPKGYLKVTDASEFVEEFARQVAAGNPRFLK